MTAVTSTAKVRENNKRVFLNSLVNKRLDIMSRRELQHDTGLSWSTISSISNELFSQGYIIPIGKERTRSGRRPVFFDINPNDNLIVGIDIYLEGIQCVISDLKGRIIEKWLRYITQNNYDEVMAVVFDLLDEVITVKYKSRKILGIGVAAQGLINIAEGIWECFPHIHNWNNVPICEILFERYKIKTWVSHDPNCILLAERTFGHKKAKEYSNLALLRLDSGIGMSIMINGSIFEDPKGIACEVGHITMDMQGHKCSCGSRGCLSEYSSGDGMLRRFIEAVELGESTDVDKDTLYKLGYKEILNAALRSDPLSVKLFKQMGIYLGGALSTIVNLFNPDIIILHGNLTGGKNLFIIYLIDTMNAYLCYKTPKQVIFSELDSLAAAHGAAILASERVINSEEFFL